MDLKILRILEKIENDNEGNKYWCIPKTSGEVLRTLVLSLGAKNILEIGCSVGYSAIWLASGQIEVHGASSRSAKVYTIESDKERADIAQKHFKQAGLDKKITILRGNALDILEKWKKRVDLVFMDANKNEYVDYYENIFPFIKNGGILVADNVISHKESSKKFLDAVAKDKRVISQLIEIDNGLMIVIKK